MQIELGKDGRYMTVKDITNALGNARVMPMRTKDRTILVNCAEYSDIYSEAPKDKEAGAEELYIREREQNPDKTDLIMKTMGLSPLGRFNSVEKAKLALRIPQSDSSILGTAIDAITGKIGAYMNT